MSNWYPSEQGAKVARADKDSPCDWVIAPDRAGFRLICVSYEPGDPDLYSFRQSRAVTT